MSPRQGVWRVPYAWGRGQRPDVAGLLPEFGPDRFGLGPSFLLRWIRVDASPETAWLWLCQLRRAPYSYDLLDNFGRPSPSIPRRDLREIGVGDRVMTIFRVVACVPGRSFDLRLEWPRRWIAARRVNLFGQLSIRYAVLPAPTGCQVVCALWWETPAQAALGRLGREALAWGDAVMMRRQLIRLASLAAQWERSGFAAT